MRPGVSRGCNPGGPTFSGNTGIIELSHVIIGKLRRRAEFLEKLTFPEIFYSGKSRPARVDPCPRAKPAGKDDEISKKQN